MKMEIKPSQDLQPPGARADLHVHSKFSDRPSEWFLRRIGAPESFVEPRDIYQRACARGMDFVTITDHNKIAGALEIAHLPGTFISCELTTYFPEDRVKLHLLVYNISEQQFAELSYLRPNLYELKDYIDQQGILHSLAHPLFRVDNRLRREHFEKLLLLFKRLEAINGSRDPRAASLLQAICKNLTPALIGELAERQRLEPRGESPWEKIFTGGSDDHSGNYLANTWTGTPAAADLAQFIEHLNAGRQRAGGSSGNSLQLAHSLYTIAYSYYHDRFGLKKGAGHDLLGELLKQLLGEGDETQARASGFRRLAEKISWAGKKKRFNPTERLLIDEIGRLFSQSINQNLNELSQERSFKTSCTLCHQLSWKFIEQLLEKLRRGNLLEALQTVTALGPVALAIAPYLAAFATQHKDKEFLRKLECEWLNRVPLPPLSRNLVVAGEPSVYRRYLKNHIDSAEPPRPTLFMNCRATAKTGHQEINFQPVAFLELNPNGQWRPPLPPFLEVFRRLEELAPDMVFISQPDPLGLTLLLGCRLLKIKSVFYLRGQLKKTISRRLGWENDFGELVGRFIDWTATLADSIVVEDQADARRLLAGGLDDKIELSPAAAKAPSASQAVAVAQVA